MKNKLAFLAMAFMAYCAATGYGAENQAAAGTPADVSGSGPVAATQSIGAKMAQARAVLSEIQGLLAEEKKILDKMQDQKEQVKKNKAAFAEHERAADSIKREVQQARGQLKEIEKELEGYARQNERFSRLQADLEKAQKERQGAEAQANEGEAKLAAAQKDLNDAKNTLAELNQQARAAKKMADDMEQARASLENEKAKRANALARAEKAVALAEKIEKERLLLAGRLAELEQNLSIHGTPEKQQKESLELAGIREEIEKENKAVREIEEKIRNDENARADAENKIKDLKKQLQARTASTRTGGKEDDLNGLNGKLTDVRRQRAATEGRLQEAEAKLRKSEKETELLSNTLAAGRQAQRNSEPSIARARILEEIENEQKTIAKVSDAIVRKEAAHEDAEKNIALLKQKVKELEKSARRGAGTEVDLSRLQSRLADVKNQRADADARLKETEATLLENEKSVTGLTNMLAAARRQAQNNMNNEKAMASLTVELEQETARLNEVAASVDKQNRELKAREDEKVRLNESLMLLKESLGKTGLETNRLHEVRLQVAAQKKIRADMEPGLAQATRDRYALEKEIKQLNQELVDAGKLVLDKKDDFKALERLADELRNEKELVQNSADLLREKEQTLQRLGAEKEVVQNRLREAEAKLAQTNELRSAEQARLIGELESEKRALRENEEKNKIAAKTLREAENATGALKERLNELGGAARLKSQKESDQGGRLRSQVAAARKQREATQEQLKKTEIKLKESSESIAALTNMIALAERQREKDDETAQSMARLSEELEHETALIKEAIAVVDKQNRDLKALEEEKNRLGTSLELIKEKFGKEGQNTNRLDEISLQIAAQKKIRADMESKLAQAARERDALEKETKQLNLALVEAGKLILNNENETKAAESVADELRNEKELVKNSTGRLREKEQAVQRLGAEKEALRDKLNTTEAKIAQQKELINDLEAKRRALGEEKKARLAADKKYADLARAEKKQKDEIDDLESKARAADKENRRLASLVDTAGAEAGSGAPAIGSVEAQETKYAQPAAGSSGKDTMAMEREILNQARGVDSQPSGQQLGRQESKQTKSRSRQNRIAEADKHYALAIQKWDEDDLDGAIDEFKTTASLNPDAAGAFYNLSLACLRKGDKAEACDYAYQAGESYIRIKNLPQAARMAVLLTKIDPASPLIQKLRNRIAAATR